MKLQLKDIAAILTGVYNKPTISGNAIYLQVSMFDQYGRVLPGVKPNITIEGNNKHLLTQGDVLFAAKGSNNFAVEYSPATGPAIASSTFLIIKPMNTNKQGMVPGYMAWYLNHPNTQKLLKSKAIGSSMPSISKKVLEELEIPVPSLERQQQILKIQDLRNQQKQITQRLEELREQTIQHQLLVATHQ